MKQKVLGHITTLSEAQELVKTFAKSNGWVDEPNVDKFDHLHEELVEMSKYLRYKSLNERKRTLKENREIFVDAVGDFFFGFCRLSNQLGIDIEEAFNLVKDDILARYNKKGKEIKIIRKK